MQPMQPIIKDEDGRYRFQKNAIVLYLLDNGGIDMNHLGRQDFSAEDFQQFAQLIGYSLNGYGELSYVSDASYCTADRMAKEGTSEKDARIAYLEEELASLKESLIEPMARLFGKHPDDLK